LILLFLSSDFWPFCEVFVDLIIWGLFSWSLLTLSYFNSASFRIDVDQLDKDAYWFGILVWFSFFPLFFKHTTYRLLLLTNFTIYWIETLDCSIIIMDSYFSEEKKNLPYYYYIHTYKLLSNYYCALLYYPQCVEIKTKGWFFFFASMFLRENFSLTWYLKGAHSVSLKKMELF